MHGFLSCINLPSPQGWAHILAQPFSPESFFNSLNSTLDIILQVVDNLPEQVTLVLLAPPFPPHKTPLPKPCAPYVHCNRNPPRNPFRLANFERLFCEAKQTVKKQFALAHTKHLPVTQIQQPASTWQTTNAFWLSAPAGSSTT